MERQRDQTAPGPRRFRIWVQGRLDKGFAEGLGGVEQLDLPAETMLSGEVVDQSQLHSTLDLLRGLGIDVLRFEVDPPRGPDNPVVSDRSHDIPDKEKG